jgi:dephospho-CoA kinase
VLLVGLTGGIAAGKSTVAAMFASRGAAVVDADRIGHALQEPGAACHAAIAEAFGPGVLDAAGRIDRRRLGAIVFADPAARRRLEAVMHPAIWAACLAAADAAAAAGRALCVVEAAVLFEAGWHAQVAKVVVVTAPEAVRLARLAARGLTPDEARRRMRTLLSPQTAAARADFVIDNGGDLAATQAAVERVHGLLAGQRKNNP